MIRRQHYLLVPMSLAAIKAEARRNRTTKYFTEGEKAEEKGNYTQDDEFSTRKIVGRAAQLTKR